MARKISQTGIDLIKRFEGCKLKAYKPVSSEKYWTIGWGHYGPDVHKGMTITQEQADTMLIKDLAKYEGYVNALTVQLTQNQFDALVSFTYNCGNGNLMRLCAGRTVAQIAQKIPEYNKAGGNVLKGLVTRRAAEQALFNKPDAAAPAPEDKVTAYVNGKEIEGAVLVGGQVLIPLRDTGNNIKDAKVTWDNVTKTATLDTP